MKNKKNFNFSLKLGRRKSFVQDLLLIEGISRAGKFLVANLLHGFKGIEPIQYYGLLEHVPYLEKFRLIDKHTAQEILKCEVDIHCYEMLIGRNLNYRKDDKSSIFNIPNYKKFLKRSVEPDGNYAVEKLRGEKLCSSFIVHELLPNIKIYFDTFSRLKVISVLRSPIYLVYSWYQRGLGKRFGDDPILFSIPLELKGKNVPWFTAGWEKQFLELSEMDRNIASIEWLMHASEKSYRLLSPKNKKKILFINYEQILMHPDMLIEKISKFLKRPIMEKDMKMILKYEKLPNLEYSDSKQDKLSLIKEKSSKLYYNKLLVLENEYVSKEENNEKH